MNRRRFLQHTAGAGLAGLGTVTVLSNFEPRSPAQANAETTIFAESVSRIERAREAAYALQRKDWEQGILAQAFLELGDWPRVYLMALSAVVLRQPDGRLAVVSDGSPTDPAMGGEAYWLAAQKSGNAALKEAVEAMLQWILKGAPRSADGTLYHVFHRREFWADGFNGAPPFLASMGYYDEAIRQIDGFQRRLWNPEKKLLAHIASEDESGKPAGDSPEFFGTGNGWAAAGLARVIRTLPANYEKERKRLALFLQQLLDGCLAYECPDGLFHNVIDQPASFVETNLAQMLAYAIYTSVDGGWLPERYLAAADRLRHAALRKIDADGFVQGACGAPDFDRAGVSAEAQAFFLMMEAAAGKHFVKH